jgi:hypothetical protein
MLVVAEFAADESCVCAIVWRRCHGKSMCCRALTILCCEVAAMATEVAAKSALASASMPQEVKP